MAALVLAAFVPLVGGCFGSFQLTRKVYQFNKNVSPDKWVRWLVFLAANIVPIYSISVMVDALFANSVEFWTGSNPIMASLEPRTLVGPDGSVVRLTPVANGAALSVVDAAGVEHRMTLLREAPGVVAAYDAEGTLVRRLTGLGTGSPRIVELAAAR